MDRIDWDCIIHYILDWAWAKGYNEAYKEGYGDGHKDGMKEATTTETE